MSAPLGAISAAQGLVQKVFTQPKGDIAERLNSRITVAILTITSTLLLSTHFFGDPITCWTPAQFTKGWNDFVNQYCYVQGTYFVSMSDELSFDDNERKRTPITYYQWVPYILAVQALMFYLPKFVWKCLCAMSGFDLNANVRHLESVWKEVQKSEATFATRVERFEKRAAPFVWDALVLARPRGSRWLPIFYMVAVVLQTLNAWLMFVWINLLLQSPVYSLWGPSILSDLMSGIDWQSSGHFPRITHCDFNRRRPASVQMDTVLCVLTLNIYYEKLLLFLWFWHFFVATASTFNCLAWLPEICVTWRSKHKVRRYLKGTQMAYEDGPSSNVSDDKFIELLGQDGLFVLHHLAVNCGDMPAYYLTMALRNTSERYHSQSGAQQHQPLLHSRKG